MNRRLLKTIMAMLLMAVGTTTAWGQCNITVAVDNTSAYTPTQIANGDFSTRPYMPFKYNGTWYNEWSSSSPNTGTYWTAVNPNGIGQGWNTTETQVFEHGLFEWINHMHIFNNNVNNAGHDYFLEMNACNSAVLYQDLPTNGHDVIRWSLDHAVRLDCGANIQSVRVEVGAPEYSGANIVAASGVNNDVNSHIQSSSKVIYRSSGITNPSNATYGFNGSNLGKLSLSQTASSDNASWHTVTGVYVIPSGQAVTRFGFIAEVESDAGCGNLLDNLTFSTLIGNMSATYGANNSVIISGYWGEENPSKKLIVQIGETALPVDMTSVTGQNFTITISEECLGGTVSSVVVYHQDYPGAETTISINQPISVSAADVNTVYDGVHSWGITAVVTEPTSGYTLTYGTSYNDCNSAVSPTFMEPGTHYVYYTVSAPGYTTEKRKATVFIDKLPFPSEVVITPPTPVEGLTYDKTKHTLISAGSATGGYTMVYALGTDGNTAPTEGWSTSLPEAKWVGDYYVWYKALGDDLHKDSEPAFVMASITAPSLLTLNLAVNNAAWGTIETQSAVYDNDFEDASDGAFESEDWVNDATYPWVINGHQLKTSNAGQDGSSPSLQTTYDFEHDGMICFRYKISSESDWDKGYFKIDGNARINGISGNGSWETGTFAVTEGTHTFEWRYEKDGSVNNNDDAFYIDDIVIIENRPDITTSVQGISGDKFLVTAIPSSDDDYFVNWTSNNVVVSTEPTYMITLTETTELTANFQNNFEGSGTADDPYLIPSLAAWNHLADKVNGGTNYSGKYFRQTADIGTEQEPITRMVGIYSGTESSRRPFSGTFDGQGHTLTVDYSGNDYETRTAPFSFASCAAIKNLIVTGNCGTAGRAAGIVGESDGSTTTIVTNCVSSVTISGGLVGGIGLGGNVDIRGCLFNGTINGESQSGGLVGWGVNTTKITNCLFAPQAGSSINGCTFYYIGSDNGGATITNSYYTTALGTAQGKQARSITAGTYVTIHDLGDGTEYDVSGITAYSHGIKYDDVYYAGNGDKVNLTLSHDEAPEGYYFSQYAVTGGGMLANPTTNSPTLTMTDANQEINIEWAAITQTFNYTGAVQTFTVPATGYYLLECYGAQGGSCSSGLGGDGGWSQLTYPLTQGDVLYIYVGGQGGSIADYSGHPEGGDGGWNGGGKGGSGVQHQGQGSYYSGGGGGGGATHIATSDIGPITGSTDFTSNHANLLLIAGGGGGGLSWGSNAGGAGGGAEGGKGRRNSEWNIAWNNGTLSCGKDGMTSSTGSGSAEGCGGGGAGYQGGNTWTVTYNANDQSYSGAGGSSWGETTNGKDYSTTAGGATTGGNGKAVITLLLQGSGTEAEPYLIPSTEVWNYLADKVNAGTNYSGKYFRQTGDFAVSSKILGYPTDDTHYVTFNGIYDGNGHTITTSISKSDERYVAPFHCIADATIKNVIVTGSVTVSGSASIEHRRHPAGLVGVTDGTCILQNCRVSANVSGCDYMGGLIGHTQAANITITGCIYSGTLTASGTEYTGGFIGWGGDNGGKTYALSNNLFAGSYSGNGKFHPVGFLYNPGGNTRTVTNTYYMTGLQNVGDDDDKSLVKGLSYKGERAYSVTGVTGVTVAAAGTPTPTYNVSGLDFYGTNGLAFNGVRYGAQGDAVSLNLSGAEHYAATKGTLTGSANPYTLTMAAANSEIVLPVASVTSGENTTYYATFSSAVSAWVNNSTLKLLANVETNSTITVDNTRTLDLNGYGIKRTGTGRVIELTGSGNLTIDDSNPYAEHRFTVTEAYGDAGLGVVNDDLTSGYQTFTGGYITGGNGVDHGAGIENDATNGVVTINGGVFIGNSSTTHGGFYWGHTNKTLNMNGGRIIYNTTAYQGAGIFIGNATMRLYGGEISHNRSTGVGSQHSGGVNIAGDCNFYVHGSPIVTANIGGNHINGVTTTPNQPNDIFLQSASKIHIDGELTNTIPMGIMLLWDGKSRQQISFNSEFIHNTTPDQFVAQNYTDNIPVRIGNAIWLWSPSHDTEIHESHQVTYDSRGGSAVTGQTVLSGEKASQPESPTYVGHTFDAWYNAQFTDAWDFANDVVTKDTTLYAHYTDDVVITTLPTAITGLIYSGSAQALVNAGTATGGTMKYSLDNSTWSESIPTGTDAGNYTVYYMVEGDATHADFIPSPNTVEVTIDYTITYDLNGGSVASANPSHYNITTETFTLNNPTKTDYTFTGWTGTDLNEPTMTVSIANGSTGNRTYTATFAIDEYRIDSIPTSWQVKIGEGNPFAPTPYGDEHPDSGYVMIPVGAEFFIIPSYAQKPLIKNLELIDKILDLSLVTTDTIVPNGWTVTGTLDVVNHPVKVSIADGASVIFDNVTINGVDNNSYQWAGLTCLGDATIILSGSNTVKGFHQFPGIQAKKRVGEGEEYTLTISGTGSLTASSNGSAAGIGSAPNFPCGHITITSGTVTATGGYNCAGIGGGYGGGSCGTITISGGTVTATGGDNAAGIGSGEESSCGNISITGGSVTATGGNNAAGIGSGNFNSSCGNISIESTVTSVTVTKGTNAPNSIGAGNDGTCGTVTIGGTVYWGPTSEDPDEYEYKSDGDTYLTTSPLVYPAP